MGSDCKSDGNADAGSNPAPATAQQKGSDPAETLARSLRQCVGMATDTCTPKADSRALVQVSHLRKRERVCLHDESSGEYVGKFLRFCSPRFSLESLLGSGVICCKEFLRKATAGAHGIAVVAGPLSNEGRIGL